MDYEEYLNGEDNLLLVNDRRAKKHFVRLLEVQLNQEHLNDKKTIAELLTLCEEN